MAGTPPGTEVPPLADAGVLAALTGREATDAALLYQLGAASARFRSEAGHQVAPLAEDVAVLLDGDGTAELRLPGLPVLAVASVSIVDGDGETPVPSRDWEFSRFGMLRRTGGGYWPDRLSSVRAVFTYGHPTIPADVADAVIQAVRFALVPTEPGVRSMTVGGESLTFDPAGVSQLWNDTVERYRIGRGDRA